MAMSAAIAHITTTVLGVMDTFGVFLETERSGVDITCGIELDGEAARRSSICRLFIRALF